MDFDLGTYIMTLRCTNCGERRTYTINKGTLAIAQKCQNCGCRTLVKVGI